MADMAGAFEWHPPEVREKNGWVSKYAERSQLRRDLSEPLPPTPPDLRFHTYPTTISDTLALLPPGLASKFRQEMLEVPFHRLADLAAEWGETAVILHDTSTQEILEAIEDGDDDTVASRMNPAPEWFEEGVTPEDRGQWSWLATESSTKNEPGKP
ncbi:hypothetical protein GCM10010452_08640 [Crossiella cryophila]